MDPDPDPASQMNLDPNGSGSATLTFYDNMSELPTRAGWGEDGDSHHEH